jgi:hypothetical protein
LNGCGLIGHRLGHCPDSVDEPRIVQAQLGGELLPMPKSDIPQTYEEIWLS